MKKLKLFLVPLIVIIIAVVIYNYPRLNIITGFAAKSVCSCTFEAKRDLESIEKGDNDIDPVYYAENEIDRENMSVTSTVFGLKKRKAIYIKDVGCVLVPEKKRESIGIKPNRKIVKSDLPYPFGKGVQKDTIFENVDYRKLKEAVQNAFDLNREEIKRTRAVVVIYKDQIIAEKYASGFSKETKLLGWSMTKSLTSAVLGVMEYKNMISLNQDNLFEEWKDDERSKITLGNLLNMNSGLEWVEDYNKISDVTQMLFLDEDMTRTQLVKPMVGKPGQYWNYSSGTTNLLSGFIRSRFESHQAYLDFWYEELIDKIGMHSMLIERDYEGNFVGSSYGWATARDWAKFGLLYLNRGGWNGEQLINESWMNFTITPAIGSNASYGAHFWLNKGSTYPSAPDDLYSCNGYQGQHIFIIPSKKMVIVRLGLTEHPEFNMDNFLAELLSSVK